MVEFTGRRDIETWLTARPEPARQSEAIVLGARSALRALPMLARSNGKQHANAKIRSAVVLPVFRATALCWAAAWMPNVRDDRRITDCAATAAYAASLVSTGLGVNERATACGYAAAYAASAASAADPVISATATVQASAAAATNPASIWQAAAADAQCLVDGQPGQILAGSKLWASEIAGMAARDTRALRQWITSGLDRKLRREDWDIWFEWYRARVEGTLPWSAEAEASCVLNVNEARWTAGPSAANADIRTILSNARVSEKSQSSPGEVIDRALHPRKNIIEVVRFDWPPGGKITISPMSPMPPDFPSPASRHDHQDRLAACHALAGDLIDLLTGQRYQGQGDFLDAVNRYKIRLPQDTDDNSNLLAADNETRFIRDLFQAEFATMGNALRARLKTFLEAHQGLRVYYPGVRRFYADVRNGRICEPLPLDAGSDVISGIEEYTPELFEPHVPEVFAAGPRAPVSSEKMPSDTDANKELENVDGPIPPPDALGEIDPEKAADLSFASKVNALWTIISSKTQDADKSTASALKLYERFKGPVEKILLWCDRFGGSNF